MQERPLPPPGWYGYASQPGWMRWWDGTRWTDHWHPLTRMSAAGDAPDAEASDPLGPGLGFAVLGLFVAGQVIVGAVVAVVTGADLDIELLLMLGGLGQLVAVVGIIWLLRRRIGRGLVAGRGRLRWGQVAAGIGAGLVAPFAVGLLVQLVVSLLELPLEDPAGVLGGVDRVGPAGMIAIILTAVVGAPVVEELAFRRGLYAGLRSRWGAMTAMVASSVVFGLAHVDVLLTGAVGLVRGLGLIVMGMLLAGLYEWTGHVATPMAAHAAFNTVGIAVALLL